LITVPAYFLQVRSTSGLRSKFEWETEVHWAELDIIKASFMLSLCSKDLINRFVLNALVASVENLSAHTTIYALCIVGFKKGPRQPLNLPRIYIVIAIDERVSNHAGHDVMLNKQWIGHG